MFDPAIIISFGKLLAIYLKENTLNDIQVQLSLV